MRKLIFLLVLGLMLLGIGFAIADDKKKTDKDDEGLSKSEETWLSDRMKEFKAEDKQLTKEEEDNITRIAVDGFYSRNIFEKKKDPKTGKMYWVSPLPNGKRYLWEDVEKYTTVGKPVLVRTLDKGPTACDYYLVPIKIKEEMAVLISVNAQTGKFAAAGIPGAESYAENFPFMSGDEAKKTVKEKVGKDAIGEPVLVWSKNHPIYDELNAVWLVRTADGPRLVHPSGWVYP